MAPAPRFSTDRPNCAGRSRLFDETQIGRLFLGVRGNRPLEWPINTLPHFDELPSWRLAERVRAAAIDHKDSDFAREIHLPAPISGRCVAFRQPAKVSPINTGVRRDWRRKSALETPAARFGASWPAEIDQVCMCVPDKQTCCSCCCCCWLTVTFAVAADVIFGLPKAECERECERRLQSARGLQSGIPAELSSTVRR